MPLLPKSQAAKKQIECQKVTEREVGAEVPYTSPGQSKNQNNQHNQILRTLQHDLGPAQQHIVGYSDDWEFSGELTKLNRAQYRFQSCSMNLGIFLEYKKPSLIGPGSNRPRSVLWHYSRKYYNASRPLHPKAMHYQNFALSD